MYATVNSFLEDWRAESAATLKVLNAITTVSLEQRVTPGGRSIGTIAWHVVLTLGEMLKRTGLAVEGPDEHAARPAEASEIAAVFEQGAASVAREIGAAWKDEDLAQVVEMYGEQWEKRTVLHSLVRHQAHHRAQLTVLMRQAGLAVPGVYGPSKEEWAAMGLPPME
jgi:uncharacterized damage-inducible protein DinB